MLLRLLVSFLAPAAALAAHAHERHVHERSDNAGLSSWIVQLKPGVDPSTIEAHHITARAKRHGGIVKTYKIGDFNAYSATFDEVTAAELEKLPEVLAVARDGVKYIPREELDHTCPAPVIVTKYVYEDALPTKSEPAPTSYETHHPGDESTPPGYGTNPPNNESNPPEYVTVPTGYGTNPPNDENHSPSYGTYPPNDVTHTSSPYETYTPPPYGTDSPPPSGSYTTPPSGTHTPPPSGTDSPPPSGTHTPPPYGTHPPTNGTYPPVNGTYPPVNGTYPPINGTYPPVNGTNPPVNGTNPPTNETVNLITQNPAPWALGSISHRKPGSTEYVYNPNGGQGTYVYVLDTGIRLTHVDFEGRASFGYNAAGGSDEPIVDHGTGVASHAVGKTYGVAKKAHVIDVNVFGDKSSTTDSVILDGFNWAVNDIIAKNRVKVSVINMSLGGALTTNSPWDAAIQNAFDMGIFVVVAAGNENVNASTRSPASSPAAFTVGNIKQNNARHNDYPGYGSNYGPAVKIFAPGTVVTGASLRSDTATIDTTGTSDATPHVAGLACYLRGLEGPSSAKDVAKRILELATKDVVTDTKGSANLLAYNGSGR